MLFDQAEFEIRCEWGEQGVQHLAPISDAIIIVDVLSFSTCVSIATARGAVIYPYRGRERFPLDFARSVSAEVAGRRGSGGYSLSPASLVNVPAGLRLVLPSPNGSNLTLATGNTPTLAGCLRNAQVVARAAMRYGRQVSVVPAGERWRDDRSLRPAVEDLLGAGAIIHHLQGRLSPEARLARDAFRSAAADLGELMLKCLSGQELVTGGFEADVLLAAAVDADNNAPLLHDGAYQCESPVS